MINVMAAPVGRAKDRRALPIGRIDGRHLIDRVIRVSGDSVSNDRVPVLKRIRNVLLGCGRFAGRIVRKAGTRCLCCGRNASRRQSAG